MNKGSSNWGSSISDEVLEGLSSDVLTIELSNNSLGGHSSELSSSSLLRDINISVIIWETLVEHLLEGLSSLEGIGDNSSSWGSWLSHDEHGNGNVVEFVNVLGLTSGSLSDGIEGIVTNNLSERLEADRLDIIKWESWGNNNTDGIVVINWDLDELLLWSEGSVVSSDWGLHKNVLCWSIIFGLLLVEGQKSLNGVVELLVEMGLLLRDSLDVLSNIEVGVINWGLLSSVDALDSSVSLEVLGDLLLNLSEILRDISVAFSESLLGELSDLTSHHALLVLEKAV